MLCGNILQDLSRKNKVFIYAEKQCGGEFFRHIAFLPDHTAPARKLPTLFAASCFMAVVMWP